MIVKWVALSALVAFLAFAPDARADMRHGAGDTGVAAVRAVADQDFSAKAKYAKKQDGGWNRTKKYR